MKITLTEYTSPTTLRLLARFLTELADSGCIEEVTDESYPAPGQQEEQGEPATDYVDPHEQEEQVVLGHVVDLTTGPTVTVGVKDMNGVEVDGEYCGEAKDPFYGTGKRSGQWKKKRGVSDAAYDAWYAGARPEAEPAAEPEKVDAAAAFANPIPDSVPTTAGDLMAWLSEEQAAGRLTPGVIADAYVTCGIALTDLFPPHSDADVAERCAKVFAVLNQ